MMEAKGVPAPKGGTTWGLNTISRILRDPAIYGRFEAEKTRMITNVFWEPSHRVNHEARLVYEDRGNAILDQDTWYRVQRRLGQNRVVSKRNTQVDYTPLHRLTSCDSCGRALSADPDKGWPAFRCKPCRGRISATKLWQQVREVLIDLVTRPAYLRALIELSDTKDKTRLDKEILELQEELPECEQRLEKALRLAVELPNYWQILEKITQEIEARKARLQADLAEKQAIVEGLTKDEEAIVDFEHQAGALADEIHDWDDNRWRKFLTTWTFRICLRWTGTGPHWTMTLLNPNPDTFAFHRS